MRIGRHNLLILLLLPIFLSLTVSDWVFADTNVSIPPGTNVLGCEENNACYIPADILIIRYETVTWSNNDSAAHTVTSVGPDGSPNEKFDSGLFLAGTTFSHTFSSSGFYEYLCMVHPWMRGTIVVADISNEPTPTQSTTSSSINVLGHSIKYEISGGKVFSITPDVDSISLIVSISSTSDGKLTITLPRAVVDAKLSNGADDEFFVLVDGSESDFDETKTSSTRKLTISFPRGAQDIEIIGTMMGSSYSPPPSYTPPRYNPPPSVPSNADVVIPRGTNVLGCEESNSCFIPYQIKVGRGSSITWYNADNAAHTVTSGTASGGPDGEFDSGLFMTGTTFSHRFDDVGAYPYTCMVHPWMTGYVIVERGGPVYSDPTPTPIPRDTVPPKILKPTDVVVDAENQQGARVTYEVLAIDDKDTLVRPSCSPSSGSLFGIGETIVKCSAMDSAGNRAQQVMFTVTVNPIGIVIPSWVKNVAEFWCDDKIDDASFIEGIQYLIDNNIIVVPSTSLSSSGSQIVPTWVKNNACWWAQGLISDEDFAQGLQYLVKEGIIVV